MRSTRWCDTFPPVERHHQLPEGTPCSTFFYPFISPICVTALSSSPKRSAKCRPCEIDFWTLVHVSARQQSPSFAATVDVHDEVYKCHGKRPRRNSSMTSFFDTGSVFAIACTLLPLCVVHSERKSPRPLIRYCSLCIRDRVEILALDSHTQRFFCHNARSSTS